MLVGGPHTIGCSYSILVCKLLIIISNLIKINGEVEGSQPLFSSDIAILA